MLEDRVSKALADIVGSGNLLSDSADCWPYGYDNSRRQHLPDAVVFPRNHEQVHAVVPLSVLMWAEVFHL